MSKKSFATKATEAAEAQATSAQETAAPAKAVKEPKAPKDWLPAFLAKLQSRGITKESLKTVPGKNSTVLKSGDKTVTWFRKESDAQRVLDAMPA